MLWWALPQLTWTDALPRELRTACLLHACSPAAPAELLRPRPMCGVLPVAGCAFLPLPAGCAPRRGTLETSCAVFLQLCLVLSLLLPLPAGCAPARATWETFCATSGERPATQTWRCATAARCARVGGQMVQLGCPACAGCPATASKCLCNIAHARRSLPLPSSPTCPPTHPPTHPPTPCRPRAPRGAANPPGPAADPAHAR